MDALKKLAISFGMLLIAIIAGCGSNSANQQNDASTQQPSESAQLQPQSSVSFKGIFAYSQVDCDSGTRQLSFTLYNIFNEPISLTDTGQNKIQMFLNSVALTGLPVYCGKETLQPGDHADCFWSPAISLDPRTVLEKPIVGVEYENVLAARIPQYKAKTTFSCGQHHPTHFLTGLQCDLATKDLTFGIKNVFSKEMYLGAAPEGKTSSDVVRLRVNNHPLQTLAKYCGKDVLQPGESVDCVRKVEEGTDPLATPKGGQGTEQNQFSMEFSKYQSDVTFLC